MAFYSIIRSGKILDLCKHFQKTYPRFSCLVRSCSDAPDKEKPVKFSTSPASKWRAEDTRSSFEGDVPAAQSYIVSASVFAFIYYFFSFREESDIDELLSTSIYDRIEGLEEMQLKALYNYNEESGIDNTDVILRLKELAAKKLKT